MDKTIQIYITILMCVGMVTMGVFAWCMTEVIKDYFVEAHNHLGVTLIQLLRLAILFILLFLSLDSILG